MTETPPGAIAAVWDAGDLGCGELVLELRMRFAGLETGQVLELIARDPGAPADIPAWCRMTGNTLLRATHPVYHIQKGSLPWPTDSA